MLIDLYLVDERKNNKFGGCIYGLKMVQCYVIHVLKKKNKQNVQWNIALYSEQILEERRKWLEFCEVEG